jgi:hypothetical protein
VSAEKTSSRRAISSAATSPNATSAIAVHAAAHQLNANLVFEIADLAAEGRLRRVRPFLSRERQAALLGDRDEITKMSQFHGRPMP